MKEALLGVMLRAPEMADRIFEQHLMEKIAPNEDASELNIESPPPLYWAENEKQSGWVWH